jgi:hypothetical protein
VLLLLLLLLQLTTIQNQNQYRYPQQYLYQWLEERLRLPTQLHWPRPACPAENGCAPFCFAKAFS